METNNNSKFSRHFLEILSSLVYGRILTALRFLFCQAGLAEANVYGRQSTRHHQQCSVHGIHHLHHHAGEQWTVISHHKLPGTRPDWQQRQRQRHRPQDCWDIHRSHAAA